MEKNCETSRSHSSSNRQDLYDDDNKNQTTKCENKKKTQTKATFFSDNSRFPITKHTHTRLLDVVVEIRFTRKFEGILVFFVS